MNRRTLLKSGLSLLPTTLLSESVSGQGFGYRGGREAASGEQGTGTPCPVDAHNPSIVWRRGHCELCDHCEKACAGLQSVRDHYDISKTGKPICIHCGQCTNLCKNDAMVERFDYPAARKATKTQGVTSVISTAPAVRVSLGEMFGMKPGENVEGKMVAALKQLGFDYVLDTTFGADITIVEEASELVKRLKSGKTKQFPMFTSCCPGWVSFAQFWFPQLLPYLSSVKSPMLIQGAMIKSYFAKANNLKPTDICSMLVAPCTAKKYEITLPEMNAAGRLINDNSIRDMDIAITVRELGRWIEESGINFPKLEPQPFDKLMGKGSQSGLIFGNTGGVMEAALRSAYFFINDKPAPDSLLEFSAIRGMDSVKQADVDMGAAGKIKVAAVHGGANTRALMNRVVAGDIHFDFVEVMICPGGCIGGGGQPRVLGREAFQSARKNRIDGLYSMAEKQKLRFSHENPEVLKAYSDFLLTADSDLRTQLLHRNQYADRSSELG